MEVVKHRILSDIVLLDRNRRVVCYSRLDLPLEKRHCSEEPFNKYRLKLSVQCLFLTGWISIYRYRMDSLSISRDLPTQHTAWTFVLSRERRRGRGREEG